VIKPVDGNHGNGVSLHLQDHSQVVEAFHLAKKFSQTVLLEEMCIGKDFRILIIDGKFAAAAERTPPTVIGDGLLSVKSLIEKMNADPRRGKGHSECMTQIECDEIVLASLKRKGFNLEQVLKFGEVLVLRDNANLSSGGSALDVTNRLHHELIQLCERAARIVGLDICGIDLIHAEACLPPDAKTKIIEVNAGPGLRMHLSPQNGHVLSVADRIVDMLYPPGNNGRIPLISVTGTNGKTTVTRMIHKILSNHQNACVGMTTTDGIWIGSQHIYKGDTTGPRSCRLVLSDPKVDVAVLEVARGGILRGGLAYDFSDVSVITNISPDHIGQDGLESVEDLVWIKSLIAEKVREHGHLILNADDPTVLGLWETQNVQKAPKQLFLFSIDNDNQALQKHLAAGGNSCWLGNGFVFVQFDHVVQKLVKINEIPSALNGFAAFQVSNILAAIAAGIAIGTPASSVVQAIKSFHNTYENFGRMNLYKVKEAYVILDFAHNEKALGAIGGMLDGFKGYKKSCVLGVPGDRSDELIVNCGKAVARHFHKVLLKDEAHLRGRAQGETPKLVLQGIRSLDSACHIELASNETLAVTSALGDLQRNEILVIYFDQLNEVMALLLPYDPQPIEFIPPHSEKVHFEPRMTEEQQSPILL
jgi:cyanophycin synthetase